MVMVMVMAFVLGCGLARVTLADEAAERVNGRSALAEVERSPRSERPWAVRSETFVLSGSGFLGAAVDALGISVQKTFFERWAWEESIGWGVGNRHVGGKDLGLELAGTLRFAALMSAGRSSALTLGLGSALTLGGGYGHLNFVYAELGYEYRGAGGFSALLVAGPNWLVQAPARLSCPAAWVCDDFRAGALAPLGHVRAGLGWAF